jgi:demethylmenaquinone methyltransferase/2-methoxy-6-polyprenyl-1,4-benzoquinol methylase
VISEENDNRRVFEQTYVRSLFDSIANRYDFLNHVLSMGVDVHWRQKAIQLLRPLHPNRILDVATGTGDLAIEASRLTPVQIFGIDISSRMLEIGQKKILSRKLEHIIMLELGEAEHLNFESNSFDVVMSAFGVRNFNNLELGLKELLRVLHKGGVVMILEFSSPRQFIVKHIYQFYFKRILPLIGGFFSNNRSAYRYLQYTVSEFPDGEDFCAILRNVGFTGTRFYQLTFGIASIYMATKA